MSQKIASRRLDQIIICQLHKSWKSREQNLRVNQLWPNHSMPQLGSFSHFWCQSPNTQQKLPTFPHFLDQVEHTDTRLMKLREPSVVRGPDVKPTQPNAQNLSKNPPKTCHTRAANFDPPTKMGGAIPTLGPWVGDSPPIHDQLARCTSFLYPLQSSSSRKAWRKIQGSGWHLESTKWVAENVGFWLLFHFFVCFFFFWVAMKEFWHIKTTKRIW